MKPKHQSSCYSSTISHIIASKLGTMQVTTSDKTLNRNLVKRPRDM